MSLPHVEPRPTAMPGLLRDQRALVTGASSGIGRAIALALAEAGADVAVNYSSAAGPAEEVAGQIREMGRRSFAVRADVGNEADVARMFAKARETFGSLDILVNNAGLELVKPFAELGLEEFRRVQSVNVDGVFMGCQILLPLLRAAAGNRRGGASIINISSVAGIVVFANQLPYTVSKAAVAHLSKGLAVEFAEGGLAIRVNSVHPGFIWTPMLAQVCERWAEEGILGESAEQVRAEMARMQLTGRLGDPEDIAAGVAYLASEDAAFVTGSELVIDGGWVVR